MSDTKFIVRKAAVLGAGVMGAQIAAHLIDARVPAFLFDLPASENDKSGIVRKAIEGPGKKLQPSPLAGRDYDGLPSRPPTTTSTCRSWASATS